jgi:isopenicillin-N N-acyltransferase like protein
MVIKHLNNIIKNKILIFLYLIVFNIFNPAKDLYPCTLWGVAGDKSESGGIIIAKNRDWAPDHTQKIKIVKPKKANRYFGLFAEGNDDPGIKAGINIKGLSVISAAASSIPRKTRDIQTGVSGVISKILSSYNSVDDLIANKEIFSHARAGFLFISDKNKIAVIEIGFEGKNYSIKIIESGKIFHTNHYLDEKMLGENQNIGESSLKRLSSVEKLLLNVKVPYTVDIFKIISIDQSNGPDNSIWRKGSTPKKERTLATWITEIPVAGNPRVYIKLANPGEQQKEYGFTIDEKFWELKSI